MTDYLEPQLDGENALLEAWRRAQAALERLGAVGLPIREAGMQRERSSAGLSLDAQAGAAEGRTVEASWEEVGFPPSGQGRGAERQGRSPRHPLLTAVERLERTGWAARGLEGAAGDRRGSRWVGLPAAEELGTPARRAAGGPSQSEPLTAAQVDLAFRRDSRRYDGGFFLY